MLRLYVNITVITITTITTSFSFTFCALPVLPPLSSPSSPLRGLARASWGCLLWDCAAASEMQPGFAEWSGGQETTLYARLPAVFHRPMRTTINIKWNTRRILLGSFFGNSYLRVLFVGMKLMCLSQLVCIKWKIDEELVV